ncbi:MAG TPA: GNAT family N-acetyltransferase [Ignavibacteria bacterium]|nr:GNAT family N-acetyltransferase [Ignavibacteria bacterium]
MLSINAINMSDEQWQLYAALDESINRKYYPEDTDQKSDWEELKRYRLTDLELLKEDHLSFNLFIENEEAIGWLGIRLSGDGAEFVIDTIYNEIPERLIKLIFEFVNSFITEREKPEIYTYTRRKGIIDSLIKAGGIIFDRKIFSRLKRDEIDRIKLRETADSISKNFNYKLVLYDTIHEEILDRYLKVYNEARVDMNFFNPDKPEIIERTKEDVLKKLKWDKGPRDKMYLYVLFDNDQITGFCSLFVRDVNKKMIDQAGGLTTVSRDYRGQNIAKYLKAEIYLKVTEEYPDFEFIRTDTYPWNKYMYRINEEMGFKPYEEYCEIKFTKEILKAYNNK